MKIIISPRLNPWVFILCFLSACSQVGPLPTTSGNPEVTIATSNTARVRNALLLEMSSKGYSLVHETPNSLNFTRDLNASAAAFYQLALGSVYSSHPALNVTYTIVPQGNQTRVFAFAHIRMQGGFGQRQDTNVTRGRVGHEIHTFLLDVKQRVESKGRS